jgi:probable F420-dependent oxidoreductase
MKIGATFPQTEIGADVVAIRDYVQALEDMSFDYVLAYDHVLGANPDRPGGWKGPYTFQTMFHEPFVLFGWMAAFTKRLEMVTGVLILPQRQTALVAKQAAQVQVLSGGRLRLGVGIGWNKVEYDALGEDFHKRGKRMDEQVGLLRELWAKPLVIFNGQFDTIPDAGINPLPAQPIPIWFGGSIEHAGARLVKHGDGWLPNYMPIEQLTSEVARLRDQLTDAGRDPATFGIDVRVDLLRQPEPTWDDYFARYRDMNISHLSLNTMSNGFTSIDQHIGVLRRFKEVLSA